MLSSPASVPASAYDDFPYLTGSFPQSHPDRLATLARLLGLTPPPLDGCRVLELGCASGGNLIPMALTMPTASFVGVDLSARQIDDGRRTVDALKLPNVELRHADIVDIGPADGRFDYIVAHGVYSWVPEPVREKLLAICRDSLVPNGVAYVSYNTLPGWRMRGMIRDMMVYHASQFRSAQQQVQQARALLDFLARSVPATTPYGMTLRQELDAIRTEPDAYVYHDHLEAVNEPVYFHQFAEAARRHGLQYLSDVDFGTMLLSDFPPQIAETLKRLGTDLVRAEQYMDFMRNRMFRRSLLVRDGAAINRQLRPGPLHGFHVGARARAESPQPSLAQGVVETYGGAKGTVRTGSALAKAAFMLMAERWPLGMPFAELVSAARAKVGEVTGDGQPRLDDAAMLGGEMLQAYTVEAVELRTQPLRLSIAPSERPVASPLARLQAIRDSSVTNLRHERTNLDDFAAKLLPLLDGTRDRGALVDALARYAADGRLEVARDGTRLTDPAVLRAVLTEALETALGSLARAALLVE